MDKFKIIKKIGDGSFGEVLKAIDRQTNELVAIKRMKQKYKTWDECINLRELKALKKLKHQNIVLLKEVIRQNDELSFVFEYIEFNVFQVYTNLNAKRKYLSENEIKSIIYQCADALAYMHKHGFFHRDLKPENMLLTESGVLKVIDFGLAREIRSRPPYTDYVATRWYRAPEIILKQANYNSPVDIFALGCIMCELYMNKPIFQGQSELDQLNKTVSILGTFTQQDWPEGVKLLAQRGMVLSQFPSVPLEKIIKNASPDAINLIYSMLRWDPNKRITASQILQHTYFYDTNSFLPKEISGADDSFYPFKKSQQRQRQLSQQQSQDHNDNDNNNNNQDNSLQQLITKQRLSNKPSIPLPQKYKKDDKEIDDILDLINQTTNKYPSPIKKIQNSRPVLPHSIEATMYQKNQSTKSVLKMKYRDNSLNSQTHIPQSNSIYQFDHLSYLPQKKFN